jgi:hypothetical protein
MSGLARRRARVQILPGLLALLRACIARLRAPLESSSSRLIPIRCRSSSTSSLRTPASRPLKSNLIAIEVQMARLRHVTSVRTISMLSLSDGPPR